MSEIERAKGLILSRMSIKRRCEALPIDLVAVGRDLISYEKTIKSRWLGNWLEDRIGRILLG